MKTVIITKNSVLYIVFSYYSRTQRKAEISAEGEEEKTGVLCLECCSLNSVQIGASGDFRMGTFFSAPAIFF